MATAIEYALMAGVAYRSTRDPKNRFPIPTGWAEIAEYYRSLPSGFEAVTFIKGNEIIISFAGTTDLNDWVNGNTIALGMLPAQLRQAADYYLQVKASAPAEATFSFTGHSLGGGLASLMAVMFGGSAFTFDQAPFRLAALTTSTTDPVTGIVTTHSIAQDLLAYLQSETTNGQPTYSAAQLQGLVNFINAANNAAPGVVPNEGNVTDINVSGEILAALPFSRIGTQADIPQQNNMAIVFGPVNLHSQALLTAFLQSNQSADANKGLSDVTFKLPDLLGMIFDERLFANDVSTANTTKENFLERLVKHQATVIDPATGATDAMITRFTADLWKLVQDGGMTMRDGLSGSRRVSDALIAFAMQKYYEETSASAGYKKELFTELSKAGEGSGGIRFDMADVSTKFATAFAQGKDLDLRVAKGFQEYFKYYLDNNLDNGDVNFTALEDQLILSMLPTLRDWYVQAGTSGMNATDTLNRNAFMLGGTGSDTLTGGTGADLLVGNAGDDTLQGGKGADILLGGTGNDTYVYKTGDGSDLILDRDGNGIIKIDDQTMAGGAQYGDKRVYKGSDANGQKHTYVYVTGDASTGGDLLVDNSILIKNYDPAAGNHLGLTWGTAVADVAPTTNPLTLPGDYIRTDDRWDANNIVGTIVTYTNMTTYTDLNGKVVQNVYMQDTNGNDAITTDKERDYINLQAAGEGDDVIASGAGQDAVYAGAGKDVIIGGENGDFLYGGSGDDRLYGATQISIEQAITNGNNDGDLSTRGDWLSGGSGDDRLQGSATRDLLFGGGGQDLLIAGAGDDLISGDAVFEGFYFNFAPITNQYVINGTSYDWNIIDLGGYRKHVDFVTNVNDYTSPDGAADVIYAGKGNDFLVGGLGNDILFGEAGDDILWGDGVEAELQGNDYLDGGAGEDVLIGNGGDDVLVGGQGNDTIYGNAGSDTYIYNVGDGIDNLYDDFTTPGANTLRFGAGVNKDNIKLHLGSLLLDVGNGDQIHIEGFNSQDVFNSVSIGRFEFFDGSSLTSDELLSRGFDLDGTAGEDSIVGTNITDRINGQGGNDTLFGMAGDDQLDGGDGDDQLVGGDGNDALNGAANADSLWGQAGDDLIDGGDGDDQLFGDEGNDILAGGYGQDSLWGGDGNDLLQGNDGNDWLIGGEDNDTLVGGLGFDQLIGEAGDDTYVFNLGDTSVGLEQAELIDDLEGRNHIQLNGDLSISEMSLTPNSNFGPDLLMLQTGHSSIGIRGMLTGAIGSIEVSGVSYTAAQFFGKTYGWQVNQSVTTGNAELQGGKMADALTGTGGNSTFTGGLGDDVLVGGGGHNIYRYDLGDGVDTITDTSAETDANGLPQTSTVVFGAGINPDDLVLSIDNGALVIGFGPSQPGALRLTGFNASNALQATRIDRFQFADGTVLTHAQLVARGFDIVGQAANENLNGSSLADRLTGGGGSDTLAGGAGDDMYTFNIGDGNDVIADNDALIGTNDTLRFGDGFVPADVLALRNGDDVTFVYGEDRVTLRSYFGGGANAVENIEFADGTQWGLAEVLAVVEASASHDWVFTGDEGHNTLYGMGGNDVLDGRGGNDTLYGSSGNDTLIGGQGSDALYGQAGSDTYIVGLSSGQEIIDETNGGDMDGVDTLQFVDGINRSNVTFYYSGNDLRVYSSEFDVTVKGQFSSDSPTSQIERAIFADGSIMSAQEIKEEVLRGSTLRDWINGFETADSISGGWGGDYLSGKGGSDTLHGDQGNDMLYGEMGADLLFGDVGNDTLVGGDGDDTLEGGADWDRLDGGAGNDTYVFGLGQGNDIIVADASGIDRVQLATGLTTANVTLHRVASPPAADLAYQGDSLVIQLNGGTDQLWIANYFDPAAPGNIETLRFADGATWDYAAISSRLTTQGGTISTLTGTNKANTFVVDHWNDVINDATLNDGDKINAAVSYRLPETIADLTLSGTLNLFGVGASGYDILRGNAGNNWFESNSGHDTLVGGKGDDVYVVQGGSQRLEPEIDPTWLNGSVVTELAGEGIDTLISNFWSAQLPDNVENLILGTPNTMTSGVSYYSDRYNDFSHKLIGNTLDNILDASIYEDSASAQSWFHYRQYSGFNSIAEFRLDGGSGIDTMIGGMMNDTYVIDNASDVVVERGIGNIWSINDTVETSLETSLLTQFPNIENVTLTGTVAINATGNAVNNRLDGSLNTAGNHLTGGAGDDTYVVGVGDFIIELPDDGNDTVVVASAASNTVQLSDYPNVENIRLQRNAGDLNVVGDALANEINGSLGNNQLSGGGGSDTVADQYLSDIVVANNSYPVGDNDLIDGGGGDDVLISRGGFDTLDGGAGNDQLYVYASGRSTNIRFGLGDDHDSLSQDAGKTVNVTVELKLGIRLGDVQLQSQSGLVTATLLDGSSLSISETNSVSLKFADGTVLAQQQIDVMLNSNDRSTSTEQNDLLFGTAGADAISALGGSDSIYASGGADVVDGGAGNDSLFGGSGADTLVGGADNDQLAGGIGADVYRFSRGFGQDVIDDSWVGGTSHGVDDGAVDVIEFDATVLPADMAVYRQVSGTTASGLVLALPATGDSVAIQNAYATGGLGAVELVRFANATQWDIPTLKSKIVGEVGYDTNDTLNAPVTTSRLEGRGGNDSLTGSAGADTLDGGTGNDSMTGLAGDDVYIVDSLSDNVIEASRGGTDTVVASVDNYILPTEVEHLQMSAGTLALHATGNSLNNSMTGNAGDNWLDGGTGSDTMAGGAGNDTYFRDSTGDVITENTNEGIDLVNSSLTYALAANLEALTLVGTNAINGTGNTSDNLVIGNSAANTLNGAGGTDILQGGAGNDVLTDTAGSGLMSGDAGTDTMTGGTNAEIFIGGLGNDTFTTAAGNDIILFNKGDGQDTFATGGTGSDTISLGGGITYADLIFTKATSDLVLKIGATDQITFKNWYAATPSKPVANLQVIAEAMAGFAAGGSDPLKDQKVENFNFAGLVGAFDAARAANSGLTSWALTNALTSFLLAGSNTAALGGDLAYQYGKNGTLAGIGITPALATLSDANLGSAAQTLTPLAGLQVGSVRLS